MPVSSEKQQANSGARVWIFFLGCLSLIFLSMFLGLFDTTTELIPAHNRIDQFCLIAAGFCGLVAGGIGIYLTKGLSIIQRVMLPVVFVIEVSIGIFLIAGHLSSIIEGRVDFPVGKTQTRQALLLISRAYQTHGKGHSQYIQTMPMWSNLEITPEDFAFMQNHRRPDDAGKNPDEIRSRGYFCAKVTLEQSDKALRILHSGSEELPQGTVVLCPVLFSYPSTQRKN